MLANVADECLDVVTSAAKRQSLHGMTGHIATCDCPTKVQEAYQKLQRQRSQVKLSPIKQITMAMDDCAEGADVEFLGTDKGACD